MSSADTAPRASTEEQGVISPDTVLALSVEVDRDAAGTTAEQGRENKVGDQVQVDPPTASGGAAGEAASLARSANDTSATAGIDNARANTVSPTGKRSNESADPIVSSLRRSLAASRVKSPPTASSSANSSAPAGGAGAGAGAAGSSRSGTPLGDRHILPPIDVSAVTSFFGGGGRSRQSQDEASRPNAAAGASNSEDHPASPTRDHTPDPAQHSPSQSKRGAEWALPSLKGLGRAAGWRAISTGASAATVEPTAGASGSQATSNSKDDGNVGGQSEQQEEQRMAGTSLTGTTETPLSPEPALKFDEAPGSASFASRSTGFEPPHTASSTTKSEMDIAFESSGEEEEGEEEGQEVVVGTERRGETYGPDRPSMGPPELIHPRPQPRTPMTAELLAQSAVVLAEEDERDKEREKKEAVPADAARSEDRRNGEQERAKTETDGDEEEGQSVQVSAPSADLVNVLGDANKGVEAFSDAPPKTPERPAPASRSSDSTVTVPPQPQSSVRTEEVSNSQPTGGEGAKTDQPSGAEQAASRAEEARRKAREVLDAAQEARSPAAGPSVTEPDDENKGEPKDVAAATTGTDADASIGRGPPSSLEADNADTVGRQSLESASSSQVPESMEGKVEVEAWRLKKLEKTESKLADVSTSLERLRAEKTALEKVVTELTPLEGLSDAEAFEAHLRNMSLKVEMGSEEIRRLTGLLEQQKGVMEEMIETHRLESHSQSERVDELQTQLEEKNAEIAKLREEASKTEEVRSELEKARMAAKEEEEKRIKSVSLLRAVRQKLVNAEKAKEEVVSERDSSRVLEQATKETLASERERWQREAEALQAQRERALAGLRSEHEREKEALRAAHDKELASQKSAAERETMATKAAHDQVVSSKDARISQLETILKEVRNERDDLFDHVQMRTAEVESMRGQMERLEHETQEMRYRLKESEELYERLAAAEEELRVRSAAATAAAADGSGAGSNGREADVNTALAEAEARHRAAVDEAQEGVRKVERERDELESVMSRTLAERAKEVERLRGTIKEKDEEYAEAVTLHREKEGKIAETEREGVELRKRVEELERRLEAKEREMSGVEERESSAREEVKTVQQQADTLRRQLEEQRAKESQLRSAQKTLREELRKLQSGVALAERQRNPGVGYFSAVGRAMNGSSAGLAYVPEGASAGAGAGPSGAAAAAGARRASMESTSSSVAPTPTDDEALNLEYLRNVILQFLEHKEMRPHLTRVLSVILRFTPQEERRLVAKASS